MIKNKNKEIRIGVLGCGGTVGQHAARKLLDQGFSVLGGQRSSCDFFENYENYSFRKVDINVPDQLNQFCEKCKIVINCISPAYRNGKAVAISANRHHCILISPVDESFFDNVDSGSIVVSAGYFPGLSEWIPAAVCRKEFDRVYELIAFQGGEGKWSANAFADIVMSAGESGYADSFLDEGECKPLSANMKKGYSFPYFQNEVTVKPYITHDMIHLQQKLDIKKVYWFNAYMQKEMVYLMMKCVSCTIHKDENALDKIRKYVKDFNEQVAEKADPSFEMAFQIRGWTGEKFRTLMGNLHVTDSSRICGYTIAETAIAALEHPERIKKGINYCQDVLPADYFERIRSELADSEYLEFHEIEEENSMKIIDKDGKIDRILCPLTG